MPVPDNVKTDVSGQNVEFTGPNGTFAFTVPDEVSVDWKDGSITVSPRGKSKRARQCWGMARTMISNCVVGATGNFRKQLSLTGVGYRAQMRGNTLNLTLGLSHDVNFAVPEGIKITAPTTGTVIIEGSDKQQVGQVAANIRSHRPPEPFKGKGIRYSNEFVFRKVGKKK